MRKQVIFTVLIAALLLGIVSSQTNRVQLSQISKTGATTGQAVTYNGSSIVWGTPTPTGVLPIANGGTNSSGTPTAGAIAYGTGSSYAFSSVGAANGVLIANGSAAPTWATNAPSAANIAAVNTANADANADRGVGLKLLVSSTGSSNFPSTATIGIEARRATASASGVGTWQLVGSNEDGLNTAYLRKLMSFTTVDNWGAWRQLFFTNSTLLPSQLPAYTGDVTSSAGSAALTIATNAVTNSKLATMVNNTVKGNTSGSTASPSDLTGTQVTSILDVFTSSLKGLVPASGGGTVNYLRADGTWAAPPGAGSGDNITINGTAIADANFNKTTPTNTTGSIPVGFATSGSSPASVSASVDMADSFDARRQKPFMDAEFLSFSAGNMSEFLGAAISAGTNTTTPAAATLGPTHPGVVLARSSTTANSGYQYSSILTLIRLGGGEQFDAVIWLPAAATGNSLRFGFQDSITATAPVDGAYVDFAAGTLTPTCKTRSNSVETASATIATLSVSTWYHLRVKIDSTSSATCSIWNDSGTLQGTVSNTTNIPTASGRELGVAVVGTNSGVTAADVYAIDYLSVGWNTALARGK